MFSAKWIWKDQEDYRLYNQTVVARKEIALRDIQQAVMRITADSFYRLYLNGEWVNDGPCRGWPEHYYYDELDVTSFLHAGVNEIRIIAKFWGTGTFHQIPQQAGLLAQLDVEDSDGIIQSLFTDGSWQVAEGHPWLRPTPKVSSQMEPQECVDMRLEDSMAFSDAVVLYGAHDGPWKDLSARDVALLTKVPFRFASFMESHIVKHKNDVNFCVPTARLVNPGIIEANHNIANGSGMATMVSVGKAVKVRVETKGYQVSLDGEFDSNGQFNIEPGEHLLLALVDEVVDHAKERSIRFIDPPSDLLLKNPLDVDHENPWCWIAFPEYAFTMDDMRWGQWGVTPDGTDLIRPYLDEIEVVLNEVCDRESFLDVLGARAQLYSSEEMFVNDKYWRFVSREVIGDGGKYVLDPENLMNDTADVTTILPCAEGDIELVYDLGEQNCGYYAFDLIAEAGVKIDIHGVEYIRGDGAIQHTRDNRNGMRYITREGLNRYVSHKRRSGRYLFITFRNVNAPVRIRHFYLIESTYPVNRIGHFSCSDSRLDQIWAISERTLKLCMEDTFTDCPLYEQTLWVGDARNESVFACSAYNATDIAARCIRLAAQSLERYPIVGCQVPSSWDCLLPAWSFLWGISVWDYYFFTGDQKFLGEMWPYVVQNLEGAEKMISDEDGLFSAPLWNLFDWSGIDDQHATVTHNSMLLAGAVDAALRMASVLDKSEDATWLNTLRDRLHSSIDAMWDDDSAAYYDSIHEDGSKSASRSQHTSILSVLYDIAGKQNESAAVNNILNPPERMVTIGSPFAMMYFYEALEKIGQADRIVQSIYDCYLPMLEEGATTVWEIFPESSYRPGEFPTRSHCHAWSSAPVYFLNRIILGIRQITPGGTEYEVSPRLNGLQWARGAVATANGVLRVLWRRNGDRLDITISAPPNVRADYVENDTHQGLQVQINHDILY
ncbi:MAG: alpha-L-rhamnosidase N-terminal domain-containing protein [candidate division KSB1 bacterium]|jgi:hypothetical protein|nr:alpha-L-rhamnosidase N-terminal domain-containing protein [candidate division KSB1 bacterium]